MTQPTSRPPRSGEWLLRLFGRRENREEALGDLEEFYLRDLWQVGSRRARFRYFRRLIGICVFRSELSLSWRSAMFKNYLVTASRHMRRQKGYAFINIAGLTIGLTAFCLIAMWMRHEFSFDRFHVKAPFIYRVGEKRHFPQQIRTGYRTPGPLSEALRADYPEIARSARVAWTGERVIRFGDQVHYERDILCVDPEFLEMFTFPLIEGEAGAALAGPYTVVVTEGTAAKYFGTDNPLGQTLNLDNRFDFTVTGVVEDVPANSHLRFDMLVPFDIVQKLGWITDAWDFSMALTYIELMRGVDPQELEEKIAGAVRTHDFETNIELFLLPLTRIHLYANLEDPDSPNRVQYVVVFFLVGLLILGMACINFMNLATALAETRCKEIGLRKVVGADRGHIVRQFLSESVLVALMGLAMSPLLIQLLLPAVNRIAGESFALTAFADLRLIGLIFAVTLLTGILAGSYPALFLSAFKPSKALKARPTAPFQGVVLRQVLVVIQMSISLVLIIISVVIFRQIDYLRNKDLGFDQEHVVSIPLGISNAENPKIYERFKSELERSPRILTVSGAFTHPTRFGTHAQDVVYNGRRLDEDMPINLTSVTFDFIETLQIEVIEGRSFSSEYGTERGNLIVNQRFEEVLGMESAVDRVISIGETYRGRVVGVMRDFHLEAVSGELIGPLALFLDPNINYIFVRLAPGDVTAALNVMKESWKEVAPHLPFAYSFLDEDFGRLYREVENLGAGLKYLTLLAGFIACLGMLGLASFAARKHTKEIGVRKIMGASVSGLILYLGGGFVRLVLVANLFAWPLAWWLGHDWLQRFPYRVNLSLWVFLSAGLIVLIATLMTVSYQILKAARVDPVKSLRFE